MTKFSEDVKRIRRCYPDAKIDSLSPLVRVIDTRLGRQREKGILHRLNEIISGSVEFCDVSFGVADNVEAEVEKLYRLFVADTQAKVKKLSENSQRGVTARVREEFKASEYGRLHNLSNQYILPEMAVRFPLVEKREAGDRIMIQTVSLDSGSDRQKLDAVKLFAKNAEIVNGRHEFRNSALIAVVKGPSGEASAADQEARDMLERSFRAVVNLDDEETYVDRVAEAAGLR